MDHSKIFAPQAPKRETRTVKGSELNGSMTLVGERDGLCAIYTTNKSKSSLMMGCLVLETEHGQLYVDPDEEYTVLADPLLPAWLGGTGEDAPQETAPSEPAPTSVGPRIMAYLSPEAWVNDYAMPIDGGYDFDVTDQVLALGKDAALMLGDNSEETDALWRNAVADGRAENWDGPYSIHIEDAIADYFEAEAEKAADDLGDKA